VHDPELVAKGVVSRGIAGRIMRVAQHMTVDGQGVLLWGFFYGVATLY